MEFINVLKDNVVFINFALLWLVVPLIKIVRENNKRNQSIEDDLRKIVRLTVQMQEFQERAERIENAILHITDEKDMKAVVQILKGMTK